MHAGSKNVLVFILVLNLQACENRLSVVIELCSRVIPFSVNWRNFSTRVISLSLRVFAVSCVSELESVITLTLKISKFRMIPNGVFLLRNLATSVGFISLHSVRLFTCNTIDLAKANCSLCNLADGSIIAKPVPNSGVTITGIKHYDFGVIKITSVVRTIVSEVFNKFILTKSL